MVTEGSNEQLIEKDGGIDPALTYTALRKKAIELVQEYCGDIWTDFNLHDPGVTILESLCFAISDLAYRTNFPIEDILADKGGKIDRKKNHFFTPGQVFSTNPVSISDFRKIIIDQEPHLHNFWLQQGDAGKSIPYLRGLYKVILQLNEEEEIAGESKSSDIKKIKQSVLSNVKKWLLRNRNIGEDYIYDGHQIADQKIDDSVHPIDEDQQSPLLLKKHKIDISAEIEIQPSQLPEEILAEIYHVLRNYLNPGLQFYTKNELEIEGLSTQEIYNGPTLMNGFINQEDLDKNRCLKIDPNDMVKEIAAVSGVLVVRNLNIIDQGSEKVKKANPHDKTCYISENEFPCLEVDKKDLKISIYINDEKITIKPSLFESLFKKKDDLRKRKYLATLSKENERGTYKPLNENERFLQLGQYRNISDYFSIQHLFPHIYRLTDELENQDNSFLSSDKAKVKQLKAYLMLFEQLLANYLSQLANIETLLSAPDNDEIIKSYFSQPLFTVPGSNYILKALIQPDEALLLKDWEDRKKNNPGDYGDTKNEYFKFLNNELENPESAIERKSRVIDQMLARFNIYPGKYPVESFVRLYCPEINYNESIALLQWKSAMLKDIPLITKNRNQGMDYSQVKPGTVTIGKKTEILLGGFELKMNCLLFIVDSDKFSANPTSFIIKQKRKSLTEHFDKHAIKTHGHAREKPAGAGSLVFKKLPLSFLKDGLNITNYRITQNGNGYQLEYTRGDEKNTWEFADKKKATDALNNFIKQLRDFNLRSEGFHLVEHILLRYRRGYKKFGFRLLDANGHVIAKQIDWVTYEEREQILKQITEIATRVKAVLENGIEKARADFEVSMSNYENCRSALKKAKIKYDDALLNYKRSDAKIAEAKADLENAKTELDNIKNVFEQEVVNFGKAKTGFEKAEAVYEKDKKNYEESKVNFITGIATELSKFCLISAGHHDKETGESPQLINPYMLVYNYNKHKKEEKEKTIVLENTLKLAQHKDKNAETILDETVKLFQQVLDDFQHRSLPDKYAGFPALQSVINLTNGREIVEDFFNLRMTVVLPAWTARFQNKIFRSYVMKLFIDNSPAHMRLHFKWLGIKEMDDFEILFFKWLNAINDNTTGARTIADELILKIYDADMY
jgi:exonuclease VII small subunit